MESLQNSSPQLDIGLMRIECQQLDQQLLALSPQPHNSFTDDMFINITLALHQHLLQYHISLFLDRLTSVP